MNSIRPRAALSLLLILLFTAWSAASDQEVLTNDDVIHMVDAKVPTSIILKKIDNSASHFQTDVDSLLSLKKRGIPDAVIDSMVSHSTAANAPDSQSKPQAGPTDAKPAQVHKRAFGSLGRVAFQVWSAGECTTDLTFELYGMRTRSGNPKCAWFIDYDDLTGICYKSLLFFSPNSFTFETNSGNQTITFSNDPRGDLGDKFLALLRRAFPDLPIHKGCK